MRQRLVQPERDQHDRRDQQEVQVRVGLARELVLLPAGRSAHEPPHVGDRDDVEVDPPQLDAERDAEHRRDRRPASRPRSAPTPSATIDSPSAMITMRPWRSAKCSGDELPALGAEEVRRRPCRSPAPTVQSTPGPCRRRSRAASSSASPARTHGDRVRPSGAAPGRRGSPREQRDVRGAHHCVGDGELHRPIAERFGHAQRGDQQRRHRHEHHQPHDALLGIDDARQPRVCRPRPPQQRQHQQPCAMPAHVGFSAISAVHCVRASTKTRSKNSSSGVTRSPSRITAVRRRSAIACPLPSPASSCNGRARN